MLVGDGGVFRMIKFGEGLRTDEPGEPGVGLVVVVDKKATWGQFHQNCMSSFCADILWPKNYITKL